MLRQRTRRRLHWLGGAAENIRRGDIVQVHNDWRVRPVAAKELNRPILILIQIGTAFQGKSPWRGVTRLISLRRGYAAKLVSANLS